MTELVGVTSLSTCVWVSPLMIWLNPNYQLPITVCKDKKWGGWAFLESWGSCEWLITLLLLQIIIIDECVVHFSFSAKFEKIDLPPSLFFLPDVDATHEWQIPEKSCPDWFLLKVRFLATSLKPVKKSNQLAIHLSWPWKEPLNEWPFQMQVSPPIHTPFQPLPDALENLQVKKPTLKKF